MNFRVEPIELKHKSKLSTYSPITFKLDPDINKYVNSFGRSESDPKYDPKNPKYLNDKIIKKIFESTITDAFGSKILKIDGYIYITIEDYDEYIIQYFDHTEVFEKLYIDVLNYCQTEFTKIKPTNVFECLNMFKSICESFNYNTESNSKYNLWPKIEYKIYSDHLKIYLVQVEYHMSENLFDICNVYIA